MSKKKNPQKKGWTDNQIIAFILIVLALIVIIITVGASFKRSAQVDDTESKQDQLAEKLKRKKEVEERISALSPRRVELEKRERKYLLYARIGIGLLLVKLNVLYWWLGCEWEFQLGDHVNFNSAILLLYSFTAYILHGSLQRFVLAVKTRFVAVVQRKNQHVLEELKQLETENKLLDEQIKELSRTNPK